LRKQKAVKKEQGMKKKVLEQVITYTPLVGIIGASFFSVSALQRQFLMLFLLIWANAFFLYKSWLTQ
jgi:polyferredoxin